MLLMDRIGRPGIAMVAVLSLSYLAGCEDGGDLQNYQDAELSDSHSHDDHDHDHGHVAGVHGGHVFELDDAHQYHAEMVFAAETKDITLYFYGSEVGTGVAASDVELELHQADESHVKIPGEASPLDGETAESCSRFVIAGSKLPEGVTSEEQLDGHFYVKIAGQDLIGSLEPHDHDHDGHEHDEHGHDEHGHGEHGDDDHAHAEHGESSAEGHSSADHK
ncbi:MAG: hypothetical protein KDA85_21535 [Planctomycetaceae bacterium]|nr:hypothetical protein [Planctomycetaceae bacterium]